MNAESRHVPALDGLRGIAILLVIPHNADVFEGTHGWLVPFATLAHMGWIGVHLFFVLSGYLITGNLLDSRNAPNYYSAFFARRVLRIFPLYYLSLIFFLWVLPLLVNLPADMLASYHNQGWLWVFLQNWAQPFGRAVYWFPHFWSLGVEEQFYLVWPFVVALCPDRRLAKVCIGLMLAAFVIRAVMLASGADPEEMYQFTICRMDSLAVGALAAIYMRRPSFANWIRRRSSWLVVIALLLMLAGAVITRGYGPLNPVTIRYGYSLLAVSLAMIMIAAVRGSTKGLPRAIGGILSNTFLRSVGRYSYAMYIFHMPINRALAPKLLPLLRPLGPSYPLLFALIITVLTYVAGAASYMLIERHFLKLKRYFVPKSPPTPVPTPTSVSA